MSDRETQLWVNTLLRGRQLAEFLAVKKHLGIQSNTDVVRHLIHKQARALRRRARPRSHQPHSPPAPLDREGQENAALPAFHPSTPPDVESLCLSCTLPDCDETDPGCRYQQATGQRQAKRERMRAYSRRARATLRVPPAPDDEA
ncbi:MAG: hypothetical protein JSV36_08585 [Anaerolineae bacterium]|nr:MAG: hypothetical protein JSV36_08585 [Anaerolineae bacterium]